MQKTISLLPQSHQLNYLLQRHVTHSLPISEAQFAQKALDAAEQVALFERFSGKKAAQSLWYEIGSGSDLSMALCFGIKHDIRLTATDLYPIAKISLINNNLARLWTSQPITNLPELTQFNIQYAAPTDAQQTDFEANTFDCITNTSVLEHIPAAALPAIFKEGYRVLKPNGLMICVIDMQDHYSYTDSSITYGHFLRYNNFVYNDLINSDIHYQNRLRYSQYKTLWKAAGFRTIYEDLAYPDAQTLAMLETLPLAEPFKNFSREDKFAKTAWVVLQKQ
ncbi:class I SAM-dependent methyltransferase [Flexibacter flexilis]|uniref:class I SAM-dependent methyltransferase n=1 Tax=Flexibacter flexilis TaxID=998 RepID=UPI0015A56DFB|nr:class I SAM-dependent methyltransferase [Flexibacter flexilis]